MPSPVPPSQFRELIPASGGSFCSKFVLGLLRLFPERLYALVAYLFKEDGSLADGFAADIAALRCSGGTGPGPGGTGTLTAPVISASDGTFLDKVTISWPTVSGATSYEIFRNNVDSVTTALSIGVVSGNSFDDVNADPGTIYYYWVKSINSTSVSAFSNSDSGFSSVEIQAIDTLDATKGFQLGTSNNELRTVRLIWIPTSGAQQYDIYRQSSDGLSVPSNFTLATKIDSNRVPFDNSVSETAGPSPVFVDNVGELVYYDSPPDPFEVYYYWVVSKGNNGTGMSKESNQADGWSVGLGNGGAPSQADKLDFSVQMVSVLPGAVRAWLVLTGSGGGGAGSDTIHGGGGGGTGAVVYGEFIITGATPKFRIVITPNDDLTTNAPGQSDGENGTQIQVQFAPDGTTWTTIMTTLAPGGGYYNSAGGGLGGINASGTKAGSILRGDVKDGYDGLPAVGSKGGRAGYIYGSYRLPPAHYGAGINTGAALFKSDGAAGGGSSAKPVGLQNGGRGRTGTLLIFYQTF